ncbi:uncharacterized protein BCR38DRAFT_355499 [Pseudomassariella vexata]|uniref:Rab-GAP TBC domain-containing protein n=1 Tax=Pseudomassariella vexata TaxID=1141098 RepID=A0A1Y2DBY7_9PEZI|nr:uncharacterized protein BCR38DRAFT_355499 [Pseudomassariella vexata]ORY56626.1 hypothetical protein BCR38DRAFT_355499 [Pseudomassariella vexata]
MEGGPLSGPSGTSVFEGDPGQFSAATSVRGPSVRRERSLKFREFGLYASRVRTQTPTSSQPSTPVTYDFGPQPPPTPLSPVAPRWASLANSSTNLYDKRSASPANLQLPLTATTAHFPAPINSHGERSHSIDSETSEIRDDCPPLSPMINMNSIESRHVVGDPMLVDNFSRPRKPSLSLKQSYPESLRSRYPTNTASTISDPTQTDTSHNPHLLWPRERNHSISSNRSAATFASLPVRPSPDLHSRDSVRGRSRQANPSLTRPPLTYENGASLTRNPLRKMASAEDQLRSSYRSQLSASTAPGTQTTERSSLMTKTSSITSIYGQLDDGLSVDDVMGMYAKGFRDDSPAPGEHHHDDSRPATACSERSRRRSAMLEAMTDALPIPGASTRAPQVGPAPSPNAAVRDSVAVFRNSVISTSPAIEINADIAHGTKHDSGKLLDNHDDDIPMSRPRRQFTHLTTDTDMNDDTRDRYGFRKENQYVTKEQYDSWNSGYTDYMARRRKKWTAFLKESGLMTDDPNRFPQRSAKTKRFVRKGIPPEWRGAAWFYYAGGPAIVAKHAGVYDSLLKAEAKDVDDEAIERDLHRTFPDNIKFRSGKPSQAPPSRNSQQTVTEPMGNAARPDETPMISSLRRVLHAFSIYNPRIGYCQSLNFLAGLLLLFVESEEHAFWLLNIITRVYLPGTHELSLEGANVDLGVLMEALRDAMPAVWTKIGGELDGSDAARPKRRARGKNRVAELGQRLPPITLCMTAWFMSCFIGTLPIETTLRVWDIFFYEGSKTLFRIALAIFKTSEQEIRNVGDPMEIFQVVQTIPRRMIDANALMEACFKRRNGFGHLSQEEVEKKRDERRSAVKIERERVASGLGSSDEASDVKRKGTLFGRRREKSRGDETP